MRLIISTFLIAILTPVGLPSLHSAEVALTGKITVTPAKDEKTHPRLYRMKAHEFDYRMSLKYEMPSIGVSVYRLRFPSPVKSPYEINNTVYAEYYRPKGKGPFPGVIVLDVIGGKRVISRIMATHLAQHGIAALFVQMAYYEERQPKGERVRLISLNLPRTFNGIGQTVLDVRCATAWLEARPEVDGNQLGIVGTSLGSFLGSISAEMEPKLKKVAIVLGGGGLVDAYYDDPRAEQYRKPYEALGGTKDLIRKLVADVDPLTHAHRLKDRKVIMFAGERDQVVLPKMAKAMWEASGKQKIHWYDCDHIEAALYFLPIMREIVHHFRHP